MKPDEIRASLNRRVVWRSPNKEKAREYIFTGAIFRRGEKGFFYQAELQDLKARSIIICKLDEIEAIKKGGN